jgi:hypothetical protein
MLENEVRCLPPSLLRINLLCNYVIAKFTKSIYPIF